MMKKTPSLILCIFVSFFLIVSAQAEIYKWIDDNGVSHYSDSPTAVPNAAPLPLPQETTYPSNKDPWKGRVVGIADGDTITVLNNKPPEKIRLYGIDCPEKRQAFGTKAKQFTSRMVFKKTVDVKPVTNDRYGRTIAWVYCDGECLNEALLKAGMAWHYKKYSSDQKLAELERSARQNKAGLWSDPHAVPPWEFRHPRITKHKNNPYVIEHKNNPRKTSAAKDEHGLIYHGNYQSMKFHRPDCKYYNCSKCTVIFNSREEAIRAGYVPCRICKP